MATEILVRGWMHEDERMALRRWAFGCKVLEVGAYEGLSTMQLAMTADHVTTVDTFDGRATGTPASTEERFHANMRACGNTQKVLPIKGDSTKVLPKFQDGAFDFIFIDGDHSYQFVSQDRDNAKAILKEGGAIAFHDCNDQHPGILQAIEELMEDGWYIAERIESLCVFKKGPEPKAKRPRVALLYPTYNGWYQHAGVIPTNLVSQTIIKNGSSIITTTFNKMLCEVLNSKEEFTYLAMLHADITPNMFWLDTLITELEVNKLDMVSAVVPLKDRDHKRGLTSTGLEVPGTDWAVRRLTLHEIYDEWQLPATFQAKDIPGRTANQGLLLNSGCWVMRWDRPWIRGLYFRQQDRIVWSLTEQMYGNESASEDWDWSRQLLSRGCRLGATTAVKLNHESPEWHNRHAWGDWKRDEDYYRETGVIAKHEQEEMACAAAA